MLNPFPIQFLALLAYFILRVALGIVCFVLGKRMLRDGTSLKRRFLGTLFMIVGAQFILGLYTQIAALVLITFSSVSMWTRRVFPNTPRVMILLMGAAALSLFITGAGAFAFDLPI